MIATQGTDVLSNEAGDTEQVDELINRVRLEEELGWEVGDCGRQSMK